MSASRQRFYIVVPDLGRARGNIEALSFTGTSAQSFAAALEGALRNPELFQRWKAMQPDPDAVDPALGACDAQATVAAQQSDLHCDAQVTTTLPHSILKQRLTLLIGSNWTLRDVQSA